MIPPAVWLKAVTNRQTQLDASRRLACSVDEANQTTVGYRSRRIDNEAQRKKLRFLA